MCMEIRDHSLSFFENLNKKSKNFLVWGSLWKIAAHRTDAHSWTFGYLKVAWIGDALSCSMWGYGRWILCYEHMFLLSIWLIYFCFPSIMYHNKWLPFSILVILVSVRLSPIPLSVVLLVHLIGSVIPTDKFDVQWLHCVILKWDLHDFRLGANTKHLAAVAVSRLQGELAKEGREPPTSAFKRSRENIIPEQVTQARSSEMGKGLK